MLNHNFHPFFHALRLLLVMLTRNILACNACYVAYTSAPPDRQQMMDNNSNGGGEG